MARKSSPHYNELADIKISGATLERRWSLLANGLRACCRFTPAELTIITEKADDVVVAGLVGHVCEPARRNMGRSTFVAPFTRLGRSEMLSWLGFHEKWEVLPGKLYRFHHVSLTIYFGYEGDILKPQIFRSEWPGVRPWIGDQIGFQTPGAGQPHWQFDAIQSTWDVEAGVDSLPHLEGEQPVPDLILQTGRVDAVVAARRIPLERLHFASAAPWWQNLPGSQAHVNAPRDADAILRWILACVSYMRQELERC
jgi:hypothetical protein